MIIFLDQVILLFEIYLKEIILITEKALCTKGISHSIVFFGFKKKKQLRTFTGWNIM